MTQPEDKVLSLAWYLFQVRTGKEERAADEISELGGRTPVVPKVTRMVRIRRTRSKRQERSFVGYKSFLLVGFDEPSKEGIREVLDTHWVRGVVGLGEYASRLNGRQVYNFLSSGAWDKRSVAKLVQEWQPDYVSGDTVRLRGAGFDEVTGLAWSVNLETRKAKVKVPLFGGDFEKPETCMEIEVPLEAAYLAKVA